MVIIIIKISRIGWISTNLFGIKHSPSKHSSVTK